MVQIEEDRDHDTSDAANRPHPDPELLPVPREGGVVDDELE